MVPMRGPLSPPRFGLPSRTFRRLDLTRTFSSVNSQGRRVSVGSAVASRRGLAFARAPTPNRARASGGNAGGAGGGGGDARSIRAENPELHRLHPAELRGGVREPIDHRHGAIGPGKRGVPTDPRKRSDRGASAEEAKTSAPTVIDSRREWKRKERRENQGSRGHPSAVRPTAPRVTFQTTLDFPKSTISEEARHFARLHPPSPPPRPAPLHSPCSPTRSFLSHSFARPSCAASPGPRPPG